MIDFSEMDYVVAMWFVGNGKQDVMGCMYREKGVTDHFTIKFRTRTYVSAEAFDSDDLKQWYRAESKNLDEAHQIKGIREMCLGMAKALGTDPEGDDFDVLTIQGTPEQAMESMLVRPWCHAKTEAPKN